MHNKLNEWRDNCENETKKEIREERRKWEKNAYVQSIRLND